MIRIAFRNVDDNEGGSFLQHVEVIISEEEAKKLLEEKRIRLKADDDRTEPQVLVIKVK